MDNPVWDRVKAVLVRIASEYNSPARLGWAVAVGVLIGTTPFFGFHLLICIAVATVLRLNRAVTYLAANISVPWIAPFLIFGSLQLGSLALSGAWMPLSLDGLGAIDPGDFFGRWLLGSLLLGSALGAPAGLVTYAAVRRLRREEQAPPDPVLETMETVATAYLPQGRFVHGYVRGKFKHDPVYRRLTELLPLMGPLIDVGCGRGQTMLLLKALQPDLLCIGLDWDEPKLERARLAAGDQTDLRFEAADIRAACLADGRGAGTILMLDVLHYNAIDAQDTMLTDAADALQPGGRLLIRDIDGAAGWRATTTRVQEAIGRLVRFNRGATLVLRPAADMAAVLTERGLTVQIEPCWEGTPFANVLIHARRPADAR